MHDDQRLPCLFVPLIAGRLLLVFRNSFTGRHELDGSNVDIIAAHGRKLAEQTGEAAALENGHASAFKRFKALHFAVDGTGGERRADGHELAAALIKRLAVLNPGKTAPGGNAEHADRGGAERNHAGAHEAAHPGAHAALGRQIQQVGRRLVAAGEAQRFKSRHALEIFRNAVNAIFGAFNEVGVGQANLARDAELAFQTAGEHLGKAVVGREAKTHRSGAVLDALVVAEGAFKVLEPCVFRSSSSAKICLTRSIRRARRSSGDSFGSYSSVTDRRSTASASNWSMPKLKLR